MKNKTSIFVMFFLAIFALSSFAPIHPNIAEVTSVSSSKAIFAADKQTHRTQKFLNTRVGKWLVGKILKKEEKRQVKLSKKLAIAEKAGDIKKVEDIKKKMLSRASVGLITFLIGFFVALIGYAIGDSANNGGNTAGFLAVLLVISGIAAIVIGIVMLATGLVKA